MAQIQVLIALALIVAVSADMHVINFAQKCGGNIIQLRADCDSNPCVVKKGKTLGVEVDFEAPANANKLTADVRAEIMGLKLKWPGFNPDGCQGGQIQCPVKSGQKLTYKYTANVNPHYPTVPFLNVEWTLKDDSGNTAFCFRLPAKVEP